MPHLNQLPDLCLLAVFDRLPLSELVSKPPLVCRRWHQLVPSAMARRRSLVVRTSDYLQTLTDREAESVEDNLKIEPDETSATSWIIDTCHKASKLDIGFAQFYGFGVHRLLQHFAPSLVKLGIRSVWSALGDEDSTWLYRQAIHLINYGMPALKELDLLLINSHDMFPFPDVQLPIVGQLEVLTLHCSSFVHLRDTVLNFAELSETLKTIKLYSFLHPFAIDLLLRIRPEIARKFTSLFNLDDQDHRISYQDLKRFCALFTSITELKVNHCEPTLGEVLDCARPIRGLDFLNLAFTEPHPLLSYQCDHQFPSVTYVHLFFHEHHQFHELERVDFRVTFPELHKLTLICSGFKTCPLATGGIHPVSCFEQQSATLVDLCSDKLEHMQMDQWIGQNQEIEGIVKDLYYRVDWKKADGFKSSVYEYLEQN